MLEVPGWTRRDLMAAPEADVVALRWGLYAKALAPSVTIDIADRIRSLERVDRPVSAASDRAERGRAIEELRADQRRQAAMRRVLLLDDEDLDEDLDDDDEEDD